MVPKRLGNVTEIKKWLRNIQIGYLRPKFNRIRVLKAATYPSWEFATVYRICIWLKRFSTLSINWRSIVRFSEPFMTYRANISHGATNQKVEIRWLVSLLCAT